MPCQIIRFKMSKECVTYLSNKTWYQSFEQCSKFSYFMMHSYLMCKILIYHLHIFCKHIGLLKLVKLCDLHIISNSMKEFMRQNERKRTKINQLFSSLMFYIPHASDVRKILGSKSMLFYCPLNMTTLQ